MSESTKPALTAEEWASDSIRRTDKRGNVLVIVRDRGEVTEEPGGHDHALAALALNGKPFGFSHAYVELLTRLCLAASNLSRDDFVAADTLAGRVVALLPPK